MTSLSDHQSGKFVKLIYIGDSGSGKTGSLTSLVKAGYKLRILDMDNGLDSLRHFVMRDCPDQVSNVDFITYRDTYSVGPMGPQVKGQAKAFTNAMKAMESWPELGNPAEWGEDVIVVIDSLTALGRAAFNWAYKQKPDAKDPRQWYFSAQQAIEAFIAAITDESFKTNVLLISHITYVEFSDETTKGYPSAIGKETTKIIPKYFNTMILAEVTGSGKNVRRRIKTVPTGIVDLKNPVPFKIDAEVPLETGLATIFNQIKEA